MIPVMGVPILTKPELLNRLIGSIDYPVADLVIIDNGHCIISPPWSPFVERMHVVTLPSNLGVPGSWNLIIKSMPFAPAWLIVNFDAYFPSGSLERFHVESRPDALVLAQAAPPWACFSIGEQVVASVGAFDEALVPAYFEDLDMERRCVFAGVPVVQTTIPVCHDNSSTIADPKYRAKNDSTYHVNREYYQDKVQRGDMGEGRWSLQRRRALSWD